MKPTTFRQVTVTLAKDQPPYLPLPCYQNERETISCWQLTWRERVCLVFGAPLWLRQCNFGNLLQPQKPTLDNPFEETPDDR